MDGWLQLDVVRERIRLIAIITLLAGLATLAAASALPKQYEAQARLLVGDVVGAQNPTIDDVLLAEKLSQTYSVIATTRPVAERVIDALGLQMHADDLLNQVTARAGVETSYVTLAVRAATPDVAASIANEFAKQLVELAPNRSDVTGGQTASLITIVEPAEAPREPASPRIVLFTLLAVIGGAALGIALAFGIEFARPRVRSARAATLISGTPTLSLVPRHRGRRGGSKDPWKDVQTEFVVLRTNLLAVLEPKAPRTVLVTAARAGDGASTVATGLAAAWAAAGSKVIVVDASRDRRGAEPAAEGIASQPAGSLSGPGRRAASLALQATRNPRIHVLMDGIEWREAWGHLALTDIAASLQRVADAADIVIVDAQPVLSGIEAASIGSIVDATVLVVDLRTAKRRDVEMASASLTRAGVRVAGLVANRPSTSPWADLPDVDPQYAPALDWIGSEFRPAPPIRKARGAQR